MAGVGSHLAVLARGCLPVWERRPCLSSWAGKAPGTAPTFVCPGQGGTSGTPQAGACCKGEKGGLGPCPASSFCRGAPTAPGQRMGGRFNTHRPHRDPSRDRGGAPRKTVSSHGTTCWCPVRALPGGTVNDRPAVRHQEVGRPHELQLHSSCQGSWLGLSRKMTGREGAETTGFFKKGTSRSATTRACRGCRRSPQSGRAQAGGPAHLAREGQPGQSPTHGAA